MRRRSQDQNPISTLISTTTSNTMPDIFSHPAHTDSSKILATPTSACPTGCVFGSHEHAAHLEAANASMGHDSDHLGLPLPPAIYATSTSPSASSSRSRVSEGFDHEPLPELIAKYGTSSSTAWLDSERYKIWRPSQPIPESEFVPAQGYIQKGMQRSPISSLFS